MPFQPNQLIGPYALERQLGRGTFGEVWLAIHQDLGERRALKIPTDPRYVQQLRREGKIIYSLQHENIVRGCDMNTLNDPPYVAMEYIEGVTLRQKLTAAGKLPVPEALAILRQILLALAHAHENGVLHRDLKPENVLLTADGNVKVSDFGLGKVQATVAQSIVISGSLVSGEGRSVSGTLQYMSPQQQAGEVPDVGDDIYAVGIMACELLTGQRPGALGIAKLLQRAGVDGRLTLPLEKALEPDHNDRYKNVQEFAEDLDHVYPPASSTTIIVELQPATSLGKEPAAPLNVRIAPLAHTSPPVLNARKAILKSLLIASVCSLALAGCVWLIVVLARFAEAERVAAERTAAERSAAEEVTRKKEEEEQRIVDDARRLAAKKVADARRLVAEQTATPAQRAAASAQGVPVYEEVPLGDGVTIGLILIPPGEFLMGSPTTEGARENDEAQHQMKITKAFMMATTEVTEAQWQNVMRGYKDSPEMPVEDVTWKRATKFCEILSTRTDKYFRLPTEAEWEYACRAGSTGPYAGTGKLDEMGWFHGNSDGKCQPVGTKRPNAWGLYDMHGNVWEWCSDSQGLVSLAPLFEENGNRDLEVRRVFRGGAWHNNPWHCRSACRGISEKPNESPKNIAIGLRLALELP